MNADAELEAEVVALTRSEGKFVAIQRYRRATGANVKSSRAAVEEILFRHGVFSMTRRSFGNWQRHLLLAASMGVGVLFAVLLIFLSRLIRP